ncbi:hypothetical protein PRIPAC_92984 [Pristionchus pacificus]|uniref:Uncharacterized protein n=1 Tax=Pristionchus pacificus TaxID=54126 RepID=A0A454XS05_PRIPA|nr:hypothetical protein PRIPAC_92984 [Pristionchus pacificus]|eukprot:PDM76067.1 hypothetical protein PRIPAC_39671 [Pristionchus pacificus]
MFDGNSGTMMVVLSNGNSLEEKLDELKEFALQLKKSIGKLNNTKCTEPLPRIPHARFLIEASPLTLRLVTDSHLQDEIEKNAMVLHCEGGETQGSWKIIITP